MIRGFSLMGASIVARLGGWLVLGCLFLCGLPCSAVSRRQSAEQWRLLTATNAPLPQVFVHDEEIRFYFPSAPHPIGFVARFGKQRVRTQGYQATSALLRLKKNLPPVTPDGWQEPVLIAGPQWRRLATNLIAGLTPATPGHAKYYRGLLGRRLLYRDSLGRATLVPVTQPPPGIIIEHHYPIEESLQDLAALAEPQLKREFPTKSLFLLMVPPSRSFQPLLLDLRHHRCVWFSTSGLYESEEPVFGLAPTFQGISALIFESNGLALIKNPVSSVARLGNLLVQSFVGLLRVPLRKPTGHPPELAHPPGMDLSQWENWLDQHTGTHRDYGSLELLVDGERFFPRLESAISNATNHVQLHVYIFDNDDVALEIADLLKRRSQNIKIEVIFDRLASMAAGRVPPATPPARSYVPPLSSPSYLKHDSNVRVRPFLNAFCSYDHSKIYLADAAHGWMGGMNIGREYRSEWHDMMVELQGPVLNELEYRYKLDWAHAGLLGDLAYLYTLLATPKPQPATSNSSWIPMRLLPTTTTKKPFAKAVLHSLQNARNYIYAENPYLFDKQVMSYLVRARLRGVDVRVIFPHVNDSHAGGRAELMAANYLVRQGVRVFFYPGMTHVKALLVDDWACVGSGNLNQFSLKLCQEHNVATSDPSFSAKLKRELFEEDFTHCYELTDPIASEWMDFIAGFVLEGI